jgi:hypothetical protein
MELEDSHLEERAKPRCIAICGSREVCSGRIGCHWPPALEGAPSLVHKRLGKLPSHQPRHGNIQILSIRYQL